MKSPLLQRCVAGVIFSSGCFYSSLMPMDRERMLSLGKQIAEIMWLLSSIGMYIHAERKILVSYNKEKISYFSLLEEHITEYIGTKVLFVRTIIVILYSTKCNNRWNRWLMKNIVMDGVRIQAVFHFA